MSGINGDSPAHPCQTVEFIATEHGPHISVESTQSHAGLTKRELFAAMAMQGISSNTELCDQTRGTIQQVAEWAVGQADALLAELEKVK